MNRIAGALLALMLLGAAACSGDDDTDETAPPETTAPDTTAAVAETTTIARLPIVTVDCAAIIDRESDLPEGFETFIDLAALQTAPTLEPIDGFAKSALLIAPDVQIELVLPPDERDNTQIGWGAPPGIAIRVGPCPATGDESWLVFPGGYTVAAPDCVDIEVSASSEPITMQVPVGAAC